MHSLETTQAQPPQNQRHGSTTGPRERHYIFCVHGGPRITRGLRPTADYMPRPAPFIADAAPMTWRARSFRAAAGGRGVGRRTISCARSRAAAVSLILRLAASRSARLRSCAALSSRIAAYCGS